jgi:hypothetical protein
MTPNQLRHSYTTWNMTYLEQNTLIMSRIGWSAKSSANPKSAKFAVVKGQCHEIFASGFFHESVSLPQAPEYTIGRAVSNFFENSRRYLQLKVDHRYQRHQRHRWQILPPVPLVLLIPVANLPPV